MIDTLEEFLENLNRYKTHKYLYKIEGDVLDEVISLVLSSKSSKKSSNYKDYLRNKINQKLNIDRLDTLFFTDSAMYIKLFIHLKNKEEGERRACGIESEVLEEYKKRYFEDDSHKDISMWLLEFVVEDLLSFRKISPYEFKKSFIAIFINLMELVVIEKCDIKDEKLLKGFSLYLLREMFDEFLLYIAEDILFHFSNQDKKAMEFLSCFSINETIDSKGVRYKANPILDDSNHAWNITTIRSTMLQYKRAKQAIYDKKNSLLHIKKRLQEYYFDMKELENVKKEKLKKLEKIEKKIESVRKNLNKVQEATSKKVKYKDADIEKIYDKKQLISKLYRQEDEFLTNKKDIEREIKEVDLKISNKQKDIGIWEKKLKESEKILATIEKKGHPIDKQYERIKKALAKTLARR